MSNLDISPILEVAIDGADEIDPQLNLIKGGGGCALQEKVVAACAKRLIIIADSSKISPRLGHVWRRGVPLEVLPMAVAPVRRRIAETLGAKSVEFRMAIRKAGPTITDHGNVIVDADFGDIDNVKELNRALLDIPGERVWSTKCMYVCERR